MVLRLDPLGRGGGGEGGLTPDAPLGLIIITTTIPSLPPQPLQEGLRKKMGAEEVGRGASELGGYGAWRGRHVVAAGCVCVLLKTQMWPPGNRFDVSLK